MIRKGNSKFKTLHKGSELVTRVFKGDELIYQDLDALYSFKFTINTKKNSNGAENNTYKTMRVGFQWANDSVPFYPVSVDWGDGQTGTIVHTNNGDYLEHTYAEAGTYQIKLLPTVFEGGYPKEGWLSGLYFGDNNQCQVISFDKALPEGSFVMSLRVDSRTTMGYRNTTRPISFKNMSNLVSIPSNFYSNAIFRTEDATKSSMSSTFSQVCYRCGANITAENKDHNIMSVLKVLIDKLNTTGITNFYGAFNTAFRETQSATIPAGLFDSLDTSSATNMYDMFNCTFYKTASKSLTATIPAGLFDSIDASKSTNVNRMFYQTFYLAFSEGELSNIGSTVATIPAGLLPLDFSEARNADSLFEGTFCDAMTRSTAATIPDHLFDGLKIPLPTSYAKLFYQTFSAMICSSGGIPEHLFDNVTLNPNATTFNDMFNGTFSRLGYFYNATPVATTWTIPDGLFDFLSTSSGTNFSAMFCATFAEALQYSTAATIPDGFFDFLDMTHATNCYQMFYRTFDGYGRDSTVAEIPTGIFDNLNTSSCVNLGLLFSRTFYSYGSKSPLAQIPSGLFDYLDMSACTNARYLFDGTFLNVGAVNPNATIPSDLFDNLDLSNATEVGSLFSATFYGYGAANTSGVIPTGLFANIASPNATGMSSMFENTFNGAFKNSTVVTIPSDIFSALDMSSASSVNNMFSNTFSNFGTANPNLAIPSNLFANVDLSHTTKCENFFRSLFEYSFYPESYGNTNPTVIPTNLFQNIDTSALSSTKYMFLSTFHGASIAAVPQGLLANITVAPTHDRMFGQMFATNYRATTLGTSALVQLNDPFDGMSDFSWATASESTNVSALWQMFWSNNNSAGSNNYYVLQLQGSASTVLQHFNFTPANRLETFAKQGYLTDYLTIANNWK